METLSLAADDAHLSDDRIAELQAWGAGQDSGTPGLDQQSALTQDGRAREAFQQVGPSAEQDQALERVAAAKVDEAALRYGEILDRDAEFDRMQKNLPQTPQNDATQGVEDFRYDSRASDAVITAGLESGEQQAQDEGLSRTPPDAVRQAALAAHPKVQQNRGPSRGDHGQTRPAGRGGPQQSQSRRRR